MNLRNSVAASLCLFFLSGCGHGRKDSASETLETPAQKVPLTGNIKVSGAYALAPLAKKWVDGFTKLHPGVKMEIIESGTGKGLEAVMGKEADLAMVSRPLTDEEKGAGIWTISVAKDGVAPIVNAKNPYLERLLERGLSPDELQMVFTGKESVRWSELLDTTGNEKVNVYARADESGAADMLALFLYKKADTFRGTKVTGDNEMIKRIQADPLALGFCNFTYAFSGPNGDRTENIQVIPFDLDFDNKINRKEIPFRNLEEAHRSVWLGLYPEVLCRELSFASMGKPENPVVIEFLRFILTEGQEEVKTAGLCQLNDVYVKYSLGFLE
jgi:phosphate transport system substrate-binding protein